MMKHGKWFVSVWMAFSLFSLQCKNPEAQLGTNVEGPEDVINFVGTNATFTCVSPLRKCENMTFYKDDPLIWSFAFLPINNHNADFRERCMVENTTSGCTLTVRDVQMTDDGEVYCEVQYRNRSSQLRIVRGRTAKLRVIDTTEARALRGPSDKAANASNDATFTCVSPLGNCLGMTWYKDTPGTARVAVFSERNRIYLRDKYTVENSTWGCELTVKSVELRDTGSVYCQIQISQRAIERSALLLVLESEQGANLLTGPEDSLSFNGTNAVFICSSPLRNCDKMKWYSDHNSFFWMSFSTIDGSFSRLKDSCVVENTTRGCKLTVRNLQLNDAGKIFCEIQIGSKYFQGRTATLIVTTKADALQGPQDIVSHAGPNVVFTCVSPLKNCVGMSWYRGTTQAIRISVFTERNGISRRDKFSVENSTLGCNLLLKLVHELDAGYFFCRIQVSRTTVERSAFLLVLETSEETSEEIIPQEGPEDSLNFRGSYAVLICVSPLTSCYGMTWYKDLAEPFIDSLFYPINEHNSQFRDRCVVENATVGCKLTIRNLRLNDTGSFYCKLDIGGRSFQGRTAFLIVIDAAQASAQKSIIQKPADFKGPVGVDASFICVSPLRNCLGMLWYKDTPGTYRKVISIQRSDKYIIENTTAGCQLTVKRIQLEDKGVVYCHIQISRIPFEGDASLDVFEIAEDSIGGPDDSLNFRGSNVVLTCVSPLRSCGGITWYRNLADPLVDSTFYPINEHNSQFRDRYVVENATVGCKLTIRNLQLNDTGSFYCKLDIGGRSFQGRTAFLVVIKQADALQPGKIDIVTDVGSNVSFTCVSPLKNCVGMSWYRGTTPDNRIAVFSEHIGINRKDKYSVENSTLGCNLLVKNLELRDAGYVFCQILISRRTIEKAAFLLVLETPEEIPQHGPEDSLNFLGSTAVLTCVTPLRSCGGITWYKDLTIPLGFVESVFYPINEHNTQFRDRCVVENAATVGCKLTIRNLQLNDTGSFYCKLDIGGRSFQGRTAFLVVINTTQVGAQNNLIQGPEDFTGPAGADATFTCVSPLRNCIGMFWYIETPGTRYRKLISGEGDGKYICQNTTIGCQLTVKRIQFMEIGTIYCHIQISRIPFEGVAALGVFKQLTGLVPTLSFVGTDAVFTCVSHLRTCANITWHKDLQTSFGPVFVTINDDVSAVRGRYIVQNSPSGCRLTLRNVQLNDTGTVQCEIRVQGRSFKGRNADLFVFNKAEALLGPNASSSTVGADGVVTCRSPLRNCIGMKWFGDIRESKRVPIFNADTGIYPKDKYIVANSTEGCQLTVEHVERTDAGSYYCEIEISRNKYDKTVMLSVSDSTTRRPRMTRTTIPVRSISRRP